MLLISGKLLPVIQQAYEPIAERAAVDGRIGEGVILIVLSHFDSWMILCEAIDDLDGAELKNQVIVLRIYNNSNHSYNNKKQHSQIESIQKRLKLIKSFTVV